MGRAHGHYKLESFSVLLLLFITQITNDRTEQLNPAP
jgi:hypothetical protein